MRAFAIVLLLAGCLSVQAAPQMACEQPVHDFGTLDSTQNVAHTFTVWNRGDQPLAIRRVIGCCGAKTELGAKRIDPGKSTPFRVTLSLEGRNGPQKKPFYLVSDDPDRTYFQFRFDGTVRGSKRSRVSLEQAGVTNVPAANSDMDIPPVPIDYFYEAGCPDCRTVREEILPRLQAQFHGLYVIRDYDILYPSNVVTLVAYQQHFDISENKPVCMVVDQRHALNGLEAIRKRVAPRLQQAVAERLKPDWRPPRPVPVGGGHWQAAEQSLAARARSFTVPMVLVNGLIDGINPCAIGTLIFFISLLGVAGIKGRGLVLMGVSFCLASFVTYTALGFGLMRLLHAADGFPVAQTVLETVMLAALGLCAGLSLADARRYARSGDPDDITLQLPDRIKTGIRGIMKKGLGLGSLVAGGLVIGALVTALESLCTGQVYVPTLVVLIKMNRDVGRSWLFLLLYNVMFLVPLATIFILSCLGLRTQALVDWSRKHVVVSKLLLAAFFVAMGALIAIL